MGWGFLGSIGSAFKDVAKVAALPIIAPTMLAVRGIKSVAGLLTPGGQEQTLTAEAPVTPEIDTTKSVYQQDVTAKAVASAQVKEAQRIKTRRGTGATILTNPMGITKAATVMKPTLGLSNPEDKNLLGL